MTTDNKDPAWQREYKPLPPKRFATNTGKLKMLLTFHANILKIIPIKLT
jgi:hypothetical protein